MQQLATIAVAGKRFGHVSGSLCLSPNTDKVCLVACPASPRDMPPFSEAEYSAKKSLKLATGYMNVSTAPIAVAF
jgi:hypothetical protein